MINEKYWQEFYQVNYGFNQQPTSFATWVASYDAQHKEESSKPLFADLGAGNCRDSFFFHSAGYQVTAIDAAAPQKNDDVPFEYIQGDFLEQELNNFEVLYLRFVVHALPEADFDLFLAKVSAQPKTLRIYIETRSTTGVTNNDKAETFFKSSIGTEHFHMLYSKACLDVKLRRYFNALHSEESNEFSVFQEKGPYLIRYTLERWS